MKPYAHQAEIAEQTKIILDKYNIAYLAMEERTGKTLVGLMALEDKNVLIITKKAALKGWKETLEACPWLKGNFELINYHSAFKCTGKYDAIILDESHAYCSANPKKNKYGKIHNDVAKITKNKPIIFMSATPSAQGYHQLYNQFSLSSYSPFKRFKNFYRFFEKYALKTASGMPFMIRTSSTRYVKDYTKIAQDCKKEVEHLFITKTRAELNFKQEPQDILHYIYLNVSTKNWYNTLMRDKVLEGNKHTLIADTSMKLRTSLHMMEGGVLKIDDDYLQLPNSEKIDYIKANWGDNKNIAIMYQYIAEGTKLRKSFKHAQILQGITNAEGVDLSHIKTLIIYSQDFSTSRHTQRRARQANKNRLDNIDVHFLLVKNAMSEQVYKTVSVNKKNYVDKYFSKVMI